MRSCVVWCGGVWPRARLEAWIIVRTLCARCGQGALAGAWGRGLLVLMLRLSVCVSDGLLGVLVCPCLGWA